MHIKHPLLWIALITVPLTACGSQPHADNPSLNASAIKQIVDANMQPFLTNNHAPGAIVGVSVQGKRFFFSYGAATDAGAQFTSTTLVELGSCTKVFTTTLFSLAISRQQIGPNDSAQNYMPPGYTLKTSNMTPLELADFSAGMPYEVPNLPKNHDIDHYTPQDFLNWASSWIAYPPAPYVYSNPSVGLLAYLVRQATGQLWQDQIDTEITKPLSMVDTEETPTAEQMDRMAQGHARDGSDAKKWPDYAWYGAGALRSTAVDMLRFGEANLLHSQVDGRPVSDELIAAMKQAQAPIYTLPSNNQQGMAWVTNVGKQSGDSPEILKNGGTSGFSTVILMNPDKDTTIFIAVNQGIGGDASEGVLENDLGSASTTNPNDPTSVGVNIGRQLP